MGATPATLPHTARWPPPIFITDSHPNAATGQEPFVFPCIFLRFISSFVCLSGSLPGILLSRRLDPPPEVVSVFECRTTTLLVLILQPPYLPPLMNPRDLRTRHRFAFCLYVLFFRYLLFHRPRFRSCAKARYGLDYANRGGIFLLLLSFH